MPFCSAPVHLTIPKREIIKKKVFEDSWINPLARKVATLSWKLHKMAPKRPFSEDDFNCPVCRDVFRDPVILTCSHSFCKRCVERSWEAKGTRECPVCRVTEFMDSPVQNLILKTLCENLRNERKKAAVRPQCSLHGKALQFFSTDTEEVMCVVCRDSATHTSNFRPIEDVALDAKVKHCEGYSIYYYII